MNKEQPLFIHSDGANGSQASQPHPPSTAKTTEQTVTTKKSEETASGQPVGTSTAAEGISRYVRTARTKVKAMKGDVPGLESLQLPSINKTTPEEAETLRLLGLWFAKNYKNEDYFYYMSRKPTSDLLKKLKNNKNWRQEAMDYSMEIIKRAMADSEETQRQTDE